MGDLADLTTARGRARNAIWLLSLPDRPDVVEVRKDHALAALDEALDEKPDPIAPDALREAALDAAVDGHFTACNDALGRPRDWAFSDRTRRTYRQQIEPAIDAVLAVVAQHRDAEVMPERTDSTTQERLRAEIHRTAALQDRITRALAALDDDVRSSIRVARARAALTETDQETG